MPIAAFGADRTIKVRGRTTRLGLESGRKMQALVIGGGMAGLAAADALLERGHDVALVEAAPTVGGLARSIRVNDEPIEAFYHHIFPQDRETLDLVERLGLSDRLEWLPASMGVLHDGAVRPLNSPIDMFRQPFLSPVDAVRLGVGIASVVVRRGTSHLDEQPVSKAGPRLFGANGYRTMWRPLLEAKFGVSASAVPMAWLASRLKQRAGARKVTGDRLGYLRGSLATLSDAYARDIALRGAAMEVSTRANRIARDGDRWRVETTGPDGDRTRDVDLVVAALSGQLLTRIIDLPESYRDQLLSISYRGVVCVLLELSRPLSRYYWTNVTDRLGLGCVGVIEHTNLVPPERYGGRHLIYLAHYVSRDDRAWDATEDQLIGSAEPAFVSLNPDYDRSWIVGRHVAREPFAQPIPQVGGPMPHLKIETGLPGVAHASLAHIYPDDRGVSLAIGLGRRAAASAMATRG